MKNYTLRLSSGEGTASFPAKNEKLQNYILRFRSYDPNGLKNFFLSQLMHNRNQIKILLRNVCVVISKHIPDIEIPESEKYQGTSRKT